MKKTKPIILLTVTVITLLLFSSIAFATSSASLLYVETAVGEDWQYDYIFINTSDAGEYLYSVWLEFDGSIHTITGSPLPANWDGTVWVGTNETTYLDTFSTGSAYDISGGGNSKRWFSFVVDYQAGNIPYTAYFDDHSGGYSQTTGITQLVPEPMSVLLFLSGGIFLAGRRYFRK